MFDFECLYFAKLLNPQKTKGYQWKDDVPIFHLISSSTLVYHKPGLRMPLETDRKKSSCKYFFPNLQALLLITQSRRRWDLNFTTLDVSSYIDSKLVLKVSYILWNTYRISSLHFLPAFLVKKKPEIKWFACQSLYLANKIPSNLFFHILISSNGICNVEEEEEEEPLWFLENIKEPS